jgi:hypothetical protein
MAKKPIKQYATLTDDSGADALSVATGGAVTLGPASGYSGAVQHTVYGAILQRGAFAGTYAAQSVLIDYNTSGNTGRLWALGPDTSTNPGFDFVSARSNGSNIITAGSYSSAGAWTLGPASGNLSQTINGGIKAGYSGCTAFHTFYRSVSSDGDAPLVVARSATENGSESYIAFYENATSASSPGSEAGGIRRNSGDTAYEFYNASDEKLKDIHGIYSGGLEVVKNIPVKYYSWKGEHNKGSFGYIAQDVQKYLPSCVSKDSNEILNLGTADMIPVMWNAIQELSAKNDALEARLAAMEAKP